MPQARDCFQVRVFPIARHMDGEIEVGEDAVAKAVLQVTGLRLRGQVSPSLVPDGGVGGAVALPRPEEQAGELSESIRCQLGGPPASG